MKRKLVLIGLVTTMFTGAFLYAQGPFFQREKVWVPCDFGYARVCQLGGSGCSFFIPCQ